MYQPLDATVQSDHLHPQASNSLKIVPGKLAFTANGQPASKPRTLSTDSMSTNAAVQSQPKIWVQALQTQGKTASKAIAQQLQEHWPKVDFSQPQWSQLAIAALLFSLPTGVSLAAFRAIAIPPQPRCNQAQAFQADLAELQCLHQAMQSNEHPTLIHSLQQLQNWSSESPVYSLSQRLLEDWSVVALSVAHQEFEAGRWENAARLATAIPTSLELGNQAQEHLTLWQKVQDQGKKAHDLALEALKQQDWQTARNHAQTLANLSNDYWRKQGIQALPEQIELARQAQQPSTPETAQLSASTVELSLPQQPQQRRRSQPAMPERSRFSMPLISLKKLTVGDPTSPTGPEFSATA